MARRRWKRNPTVPPHRLAKNEKVGKFTVADREQIRQRPLSPYGHPPSAVGAVVECGKRQENPDGLRRSYRTPGIRCFSAGHRRHGQDGAGHTLCAGVRYVNGTHRAKGSRGRGVFPFAFETQAQTGTDWIRRFSGNSERLLLAAGLSLTTGKLRVRSRAESPYEDPSAKSSDGSTPNCHHLFGVGELEASEKFLTKGRWKHHQRRNNLDANAMRLNR